MIRFVSQEFQSIVHSLHQTGHHQPACVLPEQCAEQPRAGLHLRCYKIHCFFKEIDNLSRNSYHIIPWLIGYFDFNRTRLELFHCIFVYFVNCKLKQRKPGEEI